jgi:hypothetical protein
MLNALGAPASSESLLHAARFMTRQRKCDDHVWHTIKWLLAGRVQLSCALKPDHWLIVRPRGGGRGWINQTPNDDAWSRPCDILL